MLHNMKLYNEPFDMIKSGVKTIELRLYDEKRRLIKIGDLIEFKNIDTEELLYTKVINIYVYKSFGELYTNFSKSSLGYKNDEIADPKDMELYYSISDIEKYGVVAIKLKVIDKLEYLYEIDKERRINNTVELLRDFADENMADKEKDEFIKRIK